MKKIIKPDHVPLDVIVPSAKSMAIRAIACAMLGLKFNSNLELFKINNISECDDTNACCNIASQLGFDIIRQNSKNLIIKRKGISNIQEDTSKEEIKSLDCQESALCYHIFSQIVIFFCKNFNENYRLTVAENLQRRIRNHSLTTVKTTTKQVDNLIYYDIDCSNTSQELTAILLYLPFANSNSIINIKNLVSKRYAIMTITMLEQLGIKLDYDITELKSNSCRDFKLHINGNQKITKNELNLEGDWSSGAFFFVLGAISTEVKVANLSSNSLQPDMELLELFNDLKINCTEFAKNIFCIDKSNYSGFEFSAIDCPDLVPALVVLAFNATTPSKIYEVHRLINKESNRRDVLVKVFSMLGGKINIYKDSIEIKPSKLSGGFADSNNDHRIAMALGIAAKICKQPITLTRAECVSKSYPEFWNYLAI